MEYSICDTCNGVEIVEAIWHGIWHMAYGVWHMAYVTRVMVEVLLGI